MSAHRRWLLAGGIIGLALSPQARRAVVVARDTRHRREAPCYEHDRAEARAGAASTEAAP